MICFICGQEITEGKVVELEEGYYLSGEIVDKECHYVAHASCLFNAIKEEK